LPLIRSTPASFSVPASGIRRDGEFTKEEPGRERETLAAKDGFDIGRVFAREYV